MMISLRRAFSSLLLPMLLTMAGFSLRADPLLITGSVTPQADKFRYDFAITNQSNIDPYGKLVSVDFPSLPSGSVVGNAVAPSGFGAVTDGDYILFAYNNGPSFPLGIKADGFQFVSTINLTSISFEADYLLNDESQVNVFTGRLSPQAVAAVPEPSTWLLLAGALVLLVGKKYLSRPLPHFARRARSSRPVQPKAMLPVSAGSMA